MRKKPAIVGNPLQQISLDSSHLAENLDQGALEDAAKH